MKSDRFIYAPGGLALGKGFVYFLAFSTTLFFINASDRAYYSGLLIFFCGCICDYIESWLQSSRKCRRVRNWSLLAFIVIGIVCVLNLAILLMFEKAQSVINFVDAHQIWFTLASSTLWVVPLISGFLQCRVAKSKKTSSMPPGKSMWGYSLIAYKR